MSSFICLCCKRCSGNLRIGRKAGRSLGTSFHSAKAYPWSLSQASSAASSLPLLAALSPHPTSDNSLDGKLCLRWAHALLVHHDSYIILGRHRFIWLMFSAVGENFFFFIKKQFSNKQVDVKEAQIYLESMSMKTRIKLSVCFDAKRTLVFFQQSLHWPLLQDYLPLPSNSNF